MQTPQDRAGLVLKPGKTVNLAHSEQRKQNENEAREMWGRGRAGPRAPQDLVKYCNVFAPSVKVRERLLAGVVWGGAGGNPASSVPVSAYQE